MKRAAKCFFFRTAHQCEKLSLYALYKGELLFSCTVPGMSNLMPSNFANWQGLP